LNIRCYGNILFWSDPIRPESLPVAYTPFAPL
jgi:hypothetical protein